MDGDAAVVTKRRGKARVYEDIEKLFAAGDHRGAQKRIRQLLNGSKPPTERRLRRLSTMCRNRRRKDRLREYEVLATELYRHLFGDEGELKPIVEGGAHAFCGRITRPHDAFVKVVNDAGVEARFYRLVLDGTLPRKGRFYEIVRPYFAKVVSTLSLMQLENIDADYSRTASRATFTDRRRAIAAARSIAEFNAQITYRGRPDSDAVPLPLAASQLDAKHDARLGDRLDGHGDIAEILAHQRRLRGGWRAITERMHSFTWAITNNDFHPGNFIMGDRLILVDNGASCYAPLGSDLFSFIFHNINAPRLREEVVGAYTEQLRDCGVTPDPEEIRFAANVGYCKRYLKMAPGTTTDNPATFLHAQAIGKELLDTAQAKTAVT